MVLNVGQRYGAEMSGLSFARTTPLPSILSSCKSRTLSGMKHIHGFLDQQFGEDVEDCNSINTKILKLRKEEGERGRSYRPGSINSKASKRSKARKQGAGQQASKQTNM